MRGPATQPSRAEMAAFWALIDGGNGRRIVPRLLGYLDERRRHADRWVGALTASPVPLRLIDGLLDPVSGGNMTERWRRLLPRADLVELKDVGHYPQIEAPATVLEAALAPSRSVKRRVQSNSCASAAQPLPKASTRPAK